MSLLTTSLSHSRASLQAKRNPSRLACLLTAAVVAAASLAPLACGTSAAAERRTKTPKFGEYNPDHATVEMFEAMKAGQVEVKLIVKDSTQANILLTNKTDKPLNVKLPEAFAGVPILAQFGGGGQGGGGFGGGGQQGGFGGGQGGGQQGIGGGGGGFGGGQGGGGFGGGQGGGGGLFNVTPEKVGKVKVPCMCLEHGKKDPQASMKYEIRPIESFTDKPAVHELCKLLGNGQIGQRAAQAAAWHLNNDMSWDVLAAKHVDRLGGGSHPYFSQQELQAAKGIAAKAETLAKQNERPKTTSPGESLSQN